MIKYFSSIDNTLPLCYFNYIMNIPKEKILKKGKNFIGFISNANYPRTLSLLVLLLIIVAVPLTIYIGGQNSDTRQRATGESLTCAVSVENVADSNRSKRFTWSSYNHNENSLTVAYLKIAKTNYTQISGISPVLNPDYNGSSYGSYPTVYDYFIDQRNEGSIGSRQYTLSNIPDGDYTIWCGLTSLTNNEVPTPQEACSGGLPYMSPGLSESIGIGRCTPGLSSDNTSFSIQSSSNPTATPANGGEIPTNPPIPTQPQNGNTGDTGACRNLEVNQTIPVRGGLDTNLHLWKADCNRSCTVNSGQNPNSDCPQNTFDPYIDRNDSNWCYGFVGQAKCLMLVRKTCQSAGETGCTPPAVTCNTDAVRASISSQQPTVNQALTLTLTGNAATHTNDVFQGLNCTGSNWQWINNGLDGGTRQCTVTGQPGTQYTWTHTWRHCTNNSTSDANCSPASTPCTKTVNFTVANSSSPTATPTSTPTPTSSTSCSLENQPCGSGIAGQPLGTCCQGLTCQQFADAGVCKNPNSLTRLAFTIGLQGIGSTGDNANPNATSLNNRNPRRPDRNLNIQIFNSNNQLIAENTQNNVIRFNQSTGKFHGSIAVPDIQSSGNFIIKVKSDSFLRRTLTGIQAVTPNTINPSQGSFNVTLITGDINNDNLLDILDFNILLPCFQNSTQSNTILCSASQKAASDLNDDGTVDATDYNLFLRSLSTQTGD